ncbi:MAG: DUF502 domain-containing protein [Roseicyclus sp.]
MQLPETPPPPKRGFFAGLRSSFFAGLVVIAPISVTIWLIWSLTGLIDSWVLPLIPNAYNPAVLIRDWTGIEVNIRGIGVVTFFVFTILVGWVAKGLIGRSLILWAESLVLSIPVVRSLYSGLKQIVETVLSQGEQNFEKAALIEYPRKGIWAICFISSNAKGEIQRTTEEEVVAVFMPTTPNPTSGFLLFIPRRDLIVLDMSVEDAAKLIISAGLVYPSGEDAKKALEEKVPEAAE